MRHSIDSFITRGFYLFPELQFQCETDIMRVRGYFIVNTSIDTPFYFQIWRKQNITGNFILVEQVNLNFSALCQYNNNEECYIDYLIPKGFEVEIEDFIGFYTHNNTLARPLFSSSTPNTTLFLLKFRKNIDNIMPDSLRNSTISRTVSHHPQVIGM